MTAACRRAGATGLPYLAVGLVIGAAVPEAWNRYTKPTN